MIQSNKLPFLFNLFLFGVNVALDCTDVSCSAGQDGGLCDARAVTVVHNQCLIDGVSEVDVH